MLKKIISSNSEEKIKSRFTKKNTFHICEAHVTTIIVVQLKHPFLFLRSLSNLTDSIAVSECLKIEHTQLSCALSIELAIVAAASHTTTTK